MPGNTVGHGVKGGMLNLRAAAPENIIYCSPGFAMAVANGLGAVDQSRSQAPLPDIRPRHPVNNTAAEEHRTDAVTPPNRLLRGTRHGVCRAERACQSRISYLSPPQAAAQRCHKTARAGDYQTSLQVCLSAAATFKALGDGEKRSPWYSYEVEGLMLEEAAQDYAALKRHREAYDTAVDAHHLLLYILIRPTPMTTTIARTSRPSPPAWPD